MKVESIWQELEREAGLASPASWLTRYALPNPAQPLLIALESSSRRRTLLLPLPTSAIPPRSEWPQCRGLELFTGLLDGSGFLGVRLQDSSDKEVFSVLADDVAPRVTVAPTPEIAAATLLGRLRRWQKFLTAGSSGLSPQAQKALFGELFLLRSLLQRSLDPLAVISAWVGPLHRHQDFQFSRVAVEVKTTAAQLPGVVRISSERQLDSAGVWRLFLYVLLLDERVANAAGEFEGESLREIVESVRVMLSGSLPAEMFDDRLLDAGYLQTDADLYAARRFTHRHSHLFVVSDDFPRLIEGQLPIGVGDVTYALNVDACTAHRVPFDDLVGALTS